MFLRGSHGRLALPNELPSQNKDITYLLTYLLYTFPVHHLKACYQAQQFTSFFFWRSNTIFKKIVCKSNEGHFVVSETLRLYKAKKKKKKCVY